MIGRAFEAISRLRGRRAPDLPEQAACPVAVAPGEEKKRIDGWVSPSYTESRQIVLNPGLLAQNRCLAHLDNVPEMEAYRLLRTHIIQRTQATGGNTVMVTSALPGEGKTLTAINLSFTMARQFQQTVLLADSDLRKQNIHRYLGCDGERGLIDYLTGSAALSEVIKWPGIEKITLISGGRPCQECTEMLGSPRMRGLVSELKNRYPERYVIFDAPPVLSGSDAMTLATLVDHVIFVVQAGKTALDDVRKALRFLPKEKILGLVLNRCDAAAIRQYYGYNAVASK